MRKSLTTLAALALLAACGTTPNQNPTTSNPIASTPIRQPKPKRLGLIEVKFNGLGTDQFSAQAFNIKPSGLSAKAITDVADGLQLSSSNVARSFSDVGTRGVDGQRYLYVSFRVRNASANGSTAYAEQSNLNFVAVETVAPASASVPGTAIMGLRKFDGTAISGAAATAMAPTIIPAAPVSLDVSTLKPTVLSGGHDALQVFTEAEASALKTALSPSSTSGVADVFPFGFVVTNTSDNSRTLPTPSSATDFAGIVTFAVRMPLQANASDDPYSFSMMFEAVSDSINRVTQSVEGQDAAGTAAIQARATALNASITSLNGSSIGTPVCSVRSAGSAASPLAYLVNGPTLSSVAPSANSHTVAAGASITASFLSAMNVWNVSSLSVQGFQTGLRSGTYSGDGTTNLSFAPSVGFKPGEEVEVRVGSPISSVTGQRLCGSRVQRFRAAVATGGGTFDAKVDYKTSIKPSSVTMGDVNGDGKLDMVVTNDYSSSGYYRVSVLIGNGDGTFQNRVDYATAAYPQSVKLGDVNGDGKLDMAVVNNGSSSISVLIGNGDGTFQTKVDYSTFPNPTSVTMGDVNGDGKLDLVVTNYLVLVFLGNGDGTFQNRIDVAFNIRVASESVAAVNSVTLGDVNGDGKLDMVLPAANYLSNIILVLIGNGDGTFQTEKVADYAYNGNFDPRSVTLGDLNGDGKLDLAVANYNLSSISVLIGNEDGTFQTKVDFGTRSQPSLETMGDVNGDGKLDLVVSVVINNFLNLRGFSLLNGNGDGTFQTKVDLSTSAGTLNSVTMGDVNGDSRLDMAIVNFNSSSVSVFMNLP